MKQTFHWLLLGSECRHSENWVWPSFCCLLCLKCKRLSKAVAGFLSNLLMHFLSSANKKSSVEFSFVRLWNAKTLNGNPASDELVFITFYYFFYNVYVNGVGFISILNSRIVFALCSVWDLCSRICSHFQGWFEFKLSCTSWMQNHLASQNSYQYVLHYALLADCFIIPSSRGLCFFSPSPFACLFVGWLYCRQILQACFSLQLYVKVLCDPRRTGYKPVLEQTG